MRVLRHVEVLLRRLLKVHMLRNFFQHLGLPQTRGNNSHRESLELNLKFGEALGRFSGVRGPARNPGENSPRRAISGHF